MLILALGAVVVGCVFLVVSFLTENTAWAWGCIGACGLAALVLVVDTIRRGRASHELVPDPDPDAAPAVAPGAPPDEPASGFAGPVTPTDGAPTEYSPDGPASGDAVDSATTGTDTESTQVLAVDALPVDEPSTAAHATEPDGPEPDEEDVDAADALAVGGLPTEVLVVDEHPRFHLAACPWLGNKPTLTLPIGEAIGLGFTGCARCKPSTTLAARSRAG